MSGISRRSFITSSALTALGATASGISIRTTSPQNQPIASLSSASSRVTDTSQRPISTHLGDNWIDTSVAPKSDEVIESFEFYFDIDSTLNDVTGAAGIGAHLNLYFFTSPNFGDRSPQRIEIQPWDGDIASALAIDPTKPSQYSNWTVEDILGEDGSNYVGMPAQGRSGMIKVRGTRSGDGYDISFSWRYLGEEYSPEGELQQVSIPQEATYRLKVPRIFGLTTSLKDARDFRGGAGSSSLFPFASTIHHLNDVRGNLTFTELSTATKLGFAPIHVSVTRSGSVGDSVINLGNASRPEAQQEMHVLWVEPNASEFFIFRNTKMATSEYLPSGQLVPQTQDGNTVYLDSSLGEDPGPYSIKTSSLEIDAPFTVVGRLGEQGMINDFTSTIAVVRSTRELTWVAPTINGLTRCADILAACELAEGQRSRFPTVNHGDSQANFTPVELFTGVWDLSQLDFKIYQEHNEGTVDEPRYFTDASLTVMGDDLFLGRVYLPREFDLSKPISLISNGPSRDLDFVREPYPVINPAVPVLCVPPPQSIV